MRKWINFRPQNESIWISQMIESTQTMDHAILLTSNELPQKGFYKKLSKYSILAGFGALEVIEHSFSALEKECREDWYFGFLGYDLKNELHPTLNNEKESTIEFPSLHFFRPRWVIRKQDNRWQIGYSSTIDTKESALQFIQEVESKKPELKANKIQAEIKSSLDKKSYINAFHQLQKEIHRGDVYELNFCIEFSAESVNIDPTSTFIQLMEFSPMPFSAFVKHRDKYAFCASPERYLMKEGGNLYSMPMKGTAPKGNNAQQAEKEREKLAHSEKERSENIMITDLVRNDLAQTATPGTVKVEELCGIYDFPNLFQMVSTISSELRKDKTWIDAIKDSFPMGSMTGAPKLNAMKLIDKYESTSRGLFSGAIGYITPEKDFDFNVIIRTLFYDRKNQRISFWAGSAITAQANAEDEYAECLLKTEIITKRLLNSED